MKPSKSKARTKKRVPSVSLNAFAGKAAKPNDDELAAALGASKALWDELANDLVRENEIDVQEWNSYSPKAGWSLRLKHGKRIIVYLVPLRGFFGAALVLGDRAVKVAQKADLPARSRKLLAEAPRYGEGTGLRLNVNGPEDLSAVSKLARIKLEN